MLLAFPCAYYAFSSKISVYPYSSLNLLDPFKTPFIIENKSYLPIHDVIFSCIVRKLESSESDILIMNFNVKYDSPTIPYIASGEKTKTFCNNPFKPLTPITSADIEVVVSYRPSFIPWQKQKSTRFSTIKDVKNNLIWLPKAITEKN